MIEQRRPIQDEPCVVLNLEEDGVKLEVTARLAEGVRHWTPEEAGAWFKEQWEEARQTLLVSTIYRFLGSGNGNQMVRHGEVAWQVVQMEPSPLPSPPSLPIAETPPVVRPLEMPPPAPLTPAPTPAPMPTQTASEEAEETEEQVAVQPSALSDGETPTDPQAHILSMLIEAGKQGMTISQIKEETGLNDYQTRTALKKLKEGRRVNEKKKGRTATYTSK